MRVDRAYLCLAAGAALVIVSALAGGADLYWATGQHIVRDATIDLLPHVLVAGWILVVYALWRLRRRYAYVSPSKSALAEHEDEE